MNNKITLLLPGYGLNYLWQLGAIKGLFDLGLGQQIRSVYGGSGGAWSSIFMGLGKEVVDDWLKRAPQFYVDWQKQNKFRYLHRMTKALTQESHKVLDEYGFFTLFRPDFNFNVKVFQIYPSFGPQIIDVTDASARYIHQLAVASSTIPIVTGTVARLGSNIYLDCGFHPGFREYEVDPAHRNNTTILLDPYAKKEGFEDIRITPPRPLPSGLRLGLPILMSAERIEDIIQNGYQQVMKKRNELLDVLCRQTSFSDR